MWGKLGLFVGGVVFGTAGIKVLSSKDAKNAYAHTTAAVLRAKECVMTTVTKVKENAGDVLADAKAINVKETDPAGGVAGRFINDDLPSAEVDHVSFAERF